MPQASRNRSVSGSTSPRPRTGPASPNRQALRELLGSVIVPAGLDLEDVTVSRVGRRNVVRVVVDADGGVDLDSVAAVSQVIAERLDDDTATRLVGDGPYVLEVTSPGVDRPLDDLRHWRRAVGRLVQVTVDGEEITARVTRTTEDAVGLDVAGSERLVPWEHIGRGHVQVEFHRSDDSQERSSSDSDRRGA